MSESERDETHPCHFEKKTSLSSHSHSHSNSNLDLSVGGPGPDLTVGVDTAITGEVRLTLDTLKKKPLYHLTLTVTYHSHSNSNLDLSVGGPGPDLTVGVDTAIPGEVRLTLDTLEKKTH